MTVKQCYNKFNGNYDEVLGRLGSDTFITKFIERFISDSTFDNLQSAIANENWDDAFLASHTLKGICLTMGFTCLFESVMELTERLRAKDVVNAQTAFDSFCVEYQKLIDILQTWHNTHLSDNV